MTLRDALNLMRNSDRNGNRTPFSLRWLKLDISRGTGGDFAEMKDAELIGEPKFHRGKELVNIRPFGSSQRPTSIHLRLIFDIKPHGSDHFIEVN